MATALKLMRAPSTSSSRRTRSARPTARRCRSVAAWVSGSAAIVPQALEPADDPDQVQTDGLVHVDQPSTPVGVGPGDQLLGARELVAVRGQELTGGEEAVAGQAGVGVGAGLLQRQAAVPVRQRLL